MFCTKCGTNNEDTNAFCKNCNAKLVKPATNNAGSQSVSGSSVGTQTHAPVNIMLMAGGAVVVIAILVVGYLKFANTKIGEEDFISVNGNSSQLAYNISNEDKYTVSLRSCHEITFNFDAE